MRDTATRLIAQSCTGYELLDECEKMGRHRHVEGYVAIVLSGSYQESGDTGRFSVAAGDALLHQSFEAHRNETAATGAHILNLPLPAAPSEPGMFRIDDPDLLVRLASRDFAEAAEAFVEMATRQDGAEADWPDLLAAQLRCLTPLRLADWAENHGLAPDSVTRGFAKAYGVTPRRYRAEARARTAHEAICKTEHSLSDIAADLGFADQPHMNHALRELTGHTPGHWRRRETDIAAGSGALECPRRT